MIKNRTNKKKSQIIEENVEENEEENGNKEEESSQNKSMTNKYSKNTNKSDSNNENDEEEIPKSRRNRKKKINSEHDTDQDMNSKDNIRNESYEQEDSNNKRENNNSNENKKILRNSIETSFVSGSYSDKNKNKNKNDNEKDIKDENENIRKAKTHKMGLSLNLMGENILIDAMNDVEQYNVGQFLKGDLAEIYNDVVKNNKEFKDEIFYTNVNGTEKKIGELDKTKKLHTYKEFPRSELLTGCLNYDGLLKKYIDRAKRYKTESK